jgi:ABC-type transporter Mla subunit MlaD
MSRDPMNPFTDKEFPKTPATAGLNDMKDQVSDLAAKAREKAARVAETVSGKLDQQREAAADGLNRAASAIHDKANKAVNLTHNLADGMDSTASYLRDHDLNTMGQDVMNICRRYPTQSLVAALALGFLLGRSRR